MPEALTAAVKEFLTEVYQESGGTLPDLTDDVVARALKEARQPEDPASARTELATAGNGLVIRFVNPEAVRDRSLQDEEFTNFATHLQFPRQIPKNEVWIADTVPEDDRRFFIDNAAAQLRASADGKSTAGAYEYGLKIERAERERAGQRAPVRRGEPVPHDVYRYWWKTLNQDGEKLKAFIVDGDKVREHYKSDFVEGGNAQAYPWMPEDEIWIEDQVPPEERDLVLLHEATERRLMKRDGLDYEKAHEKASKVEFDARQKQAHSRTELSAAPQPRPSPGDEIADPYAESILRQAAQAFGQFSAKVKAELLAIFKKPGNAVRQLNEARRVIERQRPALARLLSDVQLASALAAMKQVADKLPEAVPEAEPPTPDEQVRLDAIAEQIRSVPGQFRETYLDVLLPSERAYVQSVIMGEPAILPMKPPGPPFAAVEAGEAEEPPLIRFPIIDEAFQELRDRQVMTRADFDQLAGDAKWQAFTVAGVSSDETLKTIQETLAENVEQGVDYQAFLKTLDERLDTSPFISDAHAETVFRAAVQTSLSRGMDKILDQPMVADAFPYEETLPIEDDRLTELCRQVSRSGLRAHGKPSGIFRRNDPWYQKFISPRHWGCRCGRNPLSLEQAAARGIVSAQKWLETGVEPSPPDWVTPPANIQLPKGWTPHPVMLSLLVGQAVDSDFSEHLHKLYH
jgi:hypothetical protein